MDTGQSDFTDPPSTVKYVIGCPSSSGRDIGVWKRDRRVWTRDLNRGQGLGRLKGGLAGEQRYIGHCFDT